MIGEILNLNIFSFMLIFARIGTALSIMPGFGSQFIQMRARLGFAVAIAFVMTPVLAGRLPSAPASFPDLFLLLAAEMLVGAFFGTIMRIMLAALQTTGTLFAYFASMANAFIQDPISEQQGSIIATFLGTMAITLLFISGFHHVMIRAVAESYAVFVPGQGVMIGDMADMTAKTVSTSFLLGVKMATPFMVVVVAYYLGLGMLGRLMPQMPVFFVGMPIQIGLQVSVLIIVMSSIMMLFLNNFNDSLMPLMVR